MLYERWRQVAKQHRDALALRDLTSGRAWSFQQLLEASDAASAPAEGGVFPRGNDAAFIHEVLRGWRHGRFVCPLETGQPIPTMPPPPREIAHVKTTSASTGTPRLVAFTAEQIAADPNNIVATMGLRPDWPNLGVISLAHSYGFSNLVLPLLLHGIPLILGSSALPEAVRHAATGTPHLTLPAVPALWRTWFAAASIPTNVRLAISAGAPLPHELEEAVFDRQRLKVHNFYGATECGGIAYDGSEAPRAHESYVGQPMSNVTLSMADTGCLVVEGLNVGKTYWPEPGPDLGQGRFQTSDLATFRDGGVVLLGRTSDLINVAGRKVFPETIERELICLPGVRRCLVLGVPTTEGTRAEAILACVSGEPGLTAERLRGLLLNRLPAWQVPREWWFVDGLEPDQRGKISRAEWRTRFVAHQSEVQANQFPPHVK